MGSIANTTTEDSPQFKEHPGEEDDFFQENDKDAVDYQKTKEFQGVSQAYEDDDDDDDQ